MERDQAANFPLGVACALVVTLIWAGFIVVSRLGVVQNLGIFDIAGLRFAFAGLVMLPFVRAWWPRRLEWWKILILASGPGAVYALLVYAGMQYAPVAHAGVFLNGVLPVFATIVTFIVLKERLSLLKMAGIATILAGCAAVGLHGGGVDFSESWKGDLLFMCASALMAVYFLSLRLWNLQVREILVVVPVTNGAIFVPIWLLFLPSKLASAGLDEMLLQMLFQGLGPSLSAVALFSLSVRHLGSTPTAAMMAAVPVAAALMGIPILGEIPSGYDWLGMAAVTAGILLNVRSGPRAAPATVKKD